MWLIEMCIRDSIKPAPGGVRLERGIHDLLDFVAIVKIRGLNGLSKPHNKYLQQGG